MHAAATLRPFRGAPRDRVEALLSSLRTVEFPTGAILAKQGEEAEVGMLLVQGRLLCRLDPGQRDLGELWPGSLVGDRALFGKRNNHLVSVIASTDCTLLELSRADLRSHADNPAVAALQRFLIADTARRLQAVDLDIRRLWTQRDQAAAKAAAPEPTPRPPQAEAGGLLDTLKRLFGGAP